MLAMKLPLLQLVPSFLDPLLLVLPGFDLLLNLLFLCLGQFELLLLLRALEEIVVTIGRDAFNLLALLLVLLSLLDGRCWVCQLCSLLDVRIDSVILQRRRVLSSFLLVLQALLAATFHLENAVIVPF